MCSPCLPEWRGGETQEIPEHMQNLVSKFTPAVEAGMDDAGLTTVEYAVAAAVVVLGGWPAFIGPRPGSRRQDQRHLVTSVG